MYPRRRADVVTRKVDEEIIVLDRGAGKVHQLNTTASYIWDRCDGTFSAEEIAAGLAREFEVNIDIARTDVARALTGMQDLGLLAGSIRAQ